MFASERQEMIVSLLNQEGRVRVKDLSMQFQVTEDCIRKDLSILERQGLLKKAYGGAVRIRENPHLYNSEQRRHTPNEERKTIAKKAYDLLKVHETIYLDISLTSIELAKLINENKIKITVITNMIEVLNILSHCQHVSLIFIGGQLNQEGDGFWGTLAIKQAKFFKIDKAFLGVVGVDAIQGTLSTYNIDDGMMKATIIGQSQSNYTFCEERKFKEDGNYIFASLSEINGVIIAKGLSGNINKALENYGLVII